MIAKDLRFVGGIGYISPPNSDIRLGVKTVEASAFGVGTGTATALIGILYTTSCFSAGHGYGTISVERIVNVACNGIGIGTGQADSYCVVFVDAHGVGAGTAAIDFYGIVSISAIAAGIGSTTPVYLVVFIFLVPAGSIGSGSISAFAISYATLVGSGAGIGLASAVRVRPTQISSGHGIGSASLLAVLVSVLQDKIIGTGAGWGWYDAFGISNISAEGYGDSGANIIAVTLWQLFAEGHGTGLALATDLEVYLAHDTGSPWGRYEYKVDKALEDVPVAPGRMTIAATSHARRKVAVPRMVRNQ